MNRAIVALIFVIVFCLVVGSTFILITACLGTGNCVVDTSSNAGLSPIDVFGYAGVLVTILAFVAAFAIVLMTIDALAISTTVKSNSEQVNQNLSKLQSLRAGLAEAESKLGKVQVYLHVLEKFSDEMNRSSELDDDVYFVLEVLAGNIEVADQIKKKILDSRQMSRHRRTRLNALKEISLHLAGKKSERGISQVYPELIAAYRDGDTDTADILQLLSENGLLTASQQRTFKGVTGKFQAAER